MPNLTTTATKFPTLYKLTETGAVQQWKISVKDSQPFPTIRTTWGQEGGAIQETVDTILEGKNLGRKNETTAYQQACAEAKSKWEKQQKSRKYVQSREAALSGERDIEFVGGGIDPMLAYGIDKKPKAAKYPIDLQTKLDGHRCIAVIKGGICTLWSRTRKQICSMPHITQALVDLFPTADIILDGELYNHDYHDNFEELTSFIRSDEPQPGHEIVQYHIYDVVKENMIWSQRRDWLQESLGQVALPLVLVETKQAKTEAEMRVLFEQYLALSYEGAILRNLNGLYKHSRSSDLLKVKEFIDAEFECIGVGSETRTAITSAGEKTLVYPVFTVRLDNGETTMAPMMGKLETIQRFVQRPELIIGKKLTVKFQGYTKDGKLRFPKARLYDPL